MFLNVFLMCVRVLVQVMELFVEIIFLFYSIAGAVTLIVMSCLAVSALRSTKTEVKRKYIRSTFVHITHCAENVLQYLMSLNRIAPT